MDEKLLASISLQTGLDVTTCRDLFLSGYSYIEELNNYPRWELRLI